MWISMFEFEYFSTIYIENAEVKSAVESNSNTGGKSRITMHHTDIISPLMYHHVCWMNSSRAEEQCIHTWYWEPTYIIHWLVNIYETSWWIKLINKIIDTSICLTIKSRNVKPLRTSITDLHVRNTNLRFLEDTKIDK